ncbi:ClpP/crotonase-like domain-containing protein [Hyaloraphidium curvatum]|nr:ClpP/crotonase-like domain-containing protein [Hyaloraphidium curvatum]
MASYSGPYDGFDVTLDSGIATITFNRPQSLNAITRRAIHDLVDIITEFESDDRVIVVVLTGTGRYFSAGIDIGVGGASGGADPNPGEIRRNFHSTSAGSSSLLVRRIANFPKIFVAALNGPVVGIPGGWTSHADIIYATEDTTVHASFVTLALAPEAATSLSFPLRMGLGRASEALIFARKMNAKELLEAGYFNRLFPKENFHQDVHNHIKEMLKECNPRSMFEAKKLMREALEYNRKVTANLVSEVDFVSAQYVRKEPTQAFARLAERQKRLREEKQKAAKL